MSKLKVNEKMSSLNISSLDLRLMYGNSSYNLYYSTQAVCEDLITGVEADEIIE